MKAWKPVRAAAWILLFLAALAPSSMADTPLPPPALVTILSLDKKFSADLEPRTQVITVYRVDEKGVRTRDWAMVGWQRAAWLANDGEHMVFGHPGLNLLPVDVRGDDVLLYFVRRGELIATATVSDVVGNLAVLRRTASHMLWGGFVGIGADGRFAVRTVNEREVRFDVATGKKVP